MTDLTPDQPAAPDTQPPDPDGRIVEVPGRGAVNLRQGVPSSAGDAPQPERHWTNRRLARILAFQVLYEVDLAHHAPGAVLSRFVDDAVISADPDDREYVHAPLTTDVSSFARELIGGVLRHREEVDQEIQARASAWPLRQMSSVDRSILRLGLYEVRFQHGIVPVKVAINEAIELAKLFGSESLPRLVNGVLGSAVAAESAADSKPTP
jgi:transcription antitermination protein NusB